MVCQNCGKNEANVKYTQIVNGVKKEMVLCEECAEKMGISNFKVNMPTIFQISLMICLMMSNYYQVL